MYVFPEKKITYLGGQVGDQAWKFSRHWVKASRIGDPTGCNVEPCLPPPLPFSRPPSSSSILCHSLNTSGSGLKHRDCKKPRKRESVHNVLQQHVWKQNIVRERVWWRKREFSNHLIFSENASRAKRGRYRRVNLPPPHFFSQFLLPPYYVPPPSGKRLTIFFLFFAETYHRDEFFRFSFEPQFLIFHSSRCPSE